MLACTQLNKKIGKPS